MTDKVFNRMLNLAYRYLSYRPRSIHEMTVYLKKKEEKTNLIPAIIDDLIKNKFLDDHQFTNWFIENRIKFKPKSKFAMGYELKIKGIQPSISEPVLSTYDDMTLALKAVHPKIMRWRTLAPDKLKKKTMNYLRYRGFSYSVCIHVFNSLQPEENNQ